MTMPPVSPPPIHDPVQALWIGGSLPPLQQMSVRSFLAHGHPYHLFAYEEVAGLPAGALLLDAASVLPRNRIFTYQHGFGKGSYSAFSNVFRYQLLYDRGGWWVDTDVVCLRPLALPGEHILATELDDFEQEGVFTPLTATCAFKLPRGAPVLAYCLEVCAGKNPAALRWSEIGPYLFDEAIKRLGLTNHQLPYQAFSPVSTFEFRQLIEAGFDFSRLEDSWAIHFWNQIWASEGIDPEAQAHPESPYAVLKRRFAEPGLSEGPG